MLRSPEQGTRNGKSLAEGDSIAGDPAVEGLHGNTLTRRRMFFDVLFGGSIEQSHKLYIMSRKRSSSDIKSWSDCEEMQ